MKIPRHFLLKILALAVMATGATQAQALRCELVQSATACFDLDTLNGRTITVPSNVTRLENQGIALCQGRDSLGGAADIVYVYDNSGSMNATHAFISGTDTTYYYNNNNCNSTASSGTFTIQAWNGAGTATANRTITRLNSGAGCTNFSGDPYNARGRAYRLGIQNQAARASTSTAGIMSFTSTVGNSRRPLPLNVAANVTNLLGSIAAVSSGGTFYQPPLDSSKNWLLNTAITGAGRTKAVIFLSDGRPTDTTGTGNYLNVLQNNYRSPPLPAGAMPTIYGIFLGRDSTGTGRLNQLAQLTGGRFYLIPPNNPAALNAVVDSILNVILVQYNPLTLTFSNTSLGQSSPATLTLDSTVIPIRWRVRLDSVIGLRSTPSNNAFSVVSSYQRIRGGVADSVVNSTVNFTISTSGAAATTTAITPVGQGTTFATKCSPLSRIQWLNLAGARPAFFSEADSQNVRLRLRVAASDSDVANFTSGNTTRRPTADNENALLPRTTIGIDSTIFALAPVPMRVFPAATAGNGTLEPFYLDSMIARWVHPRDTRDSARDTIRVQPANQTAQVWFADPSDLATQVSSYSPVTLDTVCVVITDQRPSPAQTYQSTITVSPPPTPPSDQETRGYGNTTQLTPSVFRSSFCIDARVSTQLPNNGFVEVSPLGGQLRVVYRDPVYGDSAVATAGVGISVEESPSLEFTNAAFVPIAGNSPANPISLTQTPVYFRFQDDVGVPAVGNKPIAFNVRSLRLGQAVGTDRDSIAMSTTVSLSATRREWRGNIPLAEALAPLINNGVLQGAYLVEIVASVRSHTNRGTDTIPLLTDTLYAAYPDSLATLTWAESVNLPKIDTGGPVDVILNLRDQDFVRIAQDTVLVNVRCPSSGDSVIGIRLREVVASPGNYSSTAANGEIVIRSGGSANLSDRILSCPAGQPMLVNYTDPVSGMFSQWTINETAMPVAVPASGTPFTSEITVTLSNPNPLAAIAYTVNNSPAQPGQPIAYDPVNPILLYASDTVKAVASTPGYLRSRMLTVSYPRTPLPSSIVILDALGNPLPGDTVTDAATALSIRLTTSQGSLGTVITPFFSQTLGDNEDPALGNHVFTGTQHIYSDLVSLAGGSPSTDGNGILETALPDRLIVSWTNPLNASETVSDTVTIVAFNPGPAGVCFSDSRGGPCISQFANGTTQVFVRVETRSLPGTYQARVFSDSGGFDNEGPFTLTEVTAGSGIYYSQAVTLNENTPKTVGNGSVQVRSIGDNMRAGFRHPVFLDSVYGVAGYGVPPEVGATLRFVDASGSMLTEISPAAGQVLIRYTDDWSSAINTAVNPKSMGLNLDVMKYTVRIDGGTESGIVLTYNSAGGYWQGTIPIQDVVPVSGNGVVESQYHGVLTATVVSHNNVGAPGSPVTAVLNIRYPDQSATLTVANAVGGGPVNRFTSSVAVSVVDQPFTSVAGPNQATVRVSCAGSFDFVIVPLTGDGAGNYTATPLPKDEIHSPALPGESMSLTDGRLTCLTGDQVTAVYTDPVWGTGANASSPPWAPSTIVTLSYALVSNPSLQISNVNEPPDTGFLAIVTAETITRNAVDILVITFTTPQGETDSINAVETGPATGVFTASVPFAFTLSIPVSGNNRLDPQLNPSIAVTTVTATGTVTAWGVTDLEIIRLNSRFNSLSGPGYVRDRNGDGIVETVYLPFSQPVTRMPVSIDTIYWNSDGANRRVGSQFSLSADSLTLIVTLNGSGLGASFPPFLTGAGTPTPVAVLPATPYFGGVRVNLNDSAGPVPQTASKRPSNGAEPDPANSQVLRLKPDTLVITVSEPIMTSSNWFNVFTFTKTSNCQDTTAVRFAITTVSEPVPDPTSGSPSTGYTRFTLYSHYGLVAGQNLNCIFLQANRSAGGPGPFSDARANAPGRLGIPLSGSDAPPAIPYAGGYPPLWLPGNPIGNGMITGNPTINVNNGIIEYLPPVCPRTQVNCRDSANGRTQLIIQLPDSISAVKVITSSAYTADIRLYDHLGNFVKTWVQDFGHSGELENPNRVDPSGQGYRSFLEWDKRDEKGQRAGTGVYIWKVSFVFDTGRREIRLIRTGLVRTGL